MVRMRALLLVVAAVVGCSQDLEPPPAAAADAEPPPPETPDGIQYVQDGRYELRWDGNVPFEACGELELSDAGYSVTFIGADPACVELDGVGRENCRCYPAEGYRDWCLCPGYRRLHADFIDADPVDVVGELDAYLVGE